MIKSRTTRAWLIGALLFGAPTVIAAQTPEAADTAAPSTEDFQAWFTEMQGVRQQLQSIQAKALEDETLQARQVQLGEDLTVAMETLDPMIHRRIERVQQIESELNTAQQQGDTLALQQLTNEAQQIQQRMVTIQESALQDPEMAAKVSEFQAAVEAKMISLDPTAQGLISRLHELEQLIQDGMSRAG